jgi:GTPase involved in cell partitioning and DNA repair
MASTLAPTRLLQAFRARQLRIRHASHRGFEILIDPKALSKKQSKKRRGATSSKPSYRFVDKTRVRVMGGSGGKGSLSQEVLRRGHKMRPDGGHGGHGGSVILVADPSEQSLRWSHPHMKGEDGTNGSSKEKLGRNGKNMIIRVPCGVVVRRIVLPGDEGYEEADFLSDRSVGGAPESPEAELSDEEDIDFDDWNIDHDEDNNTGVEFFALDDLPLHEEDEVVVDSAPAASFSHDNNDDEWFAPRPVRKRVYMGDLDKPGAYTLVARGGRAGSGTMVYASEHGPLPDARELIASAQPLAGEVTHLELELKLIADIGLVGFPNAGMYIVRYSACYESLGKYRRFLTILHDSIIQASRAFCAP